VDGLKPDARAADGDGRRPGRSPIVPELRLLEIIISSSTLLILVAGTIFSFIQTEHLKTSVERAKFSQLENDLQQVNRIFVEYPQLQKYFLSGADINPSNPDYGRVYAIAVAIAMNMDESTDDVNGDKRLFEPNAWYDYYKFQFGASPILCRLLRQDHDLYGSKIVRIARHDCVATPRRPINPE
jgi:hypothetical protein